MPKTGIYHLRQGNTVKLMIFDGFNQKIVIIAICYPKINFF